MMPSNYFSVFKNFYAFYNQMPESVKNEFKITVLRFATVESLKLMADSSMISSYYGMLVLRSTLLPEQSNEGGFTSSIIGLGLTYSALSALTMIVFATQKDPYVYLPKLFGYFQNAYVSRAIEIVHFLLSASLIGYNTKELAMNVVVGSLVLQCFALYFESYFKTLLSQQHPVENEELEAEPLATALALR